MPFHPSRCALLAVLFGELVVSVVGLTLPFEARVGRHADRTGPRRRGVPQISQVSVNDLSNIEYSSIITVGGAQFNVTLDTGSSDLNIFGAVPTTQDTNIPIQVTFAQGADSGVMSFAAVEFAGYTVTNQIYNHIAGSNPAQDGTQGLLGLGPSEGSVLHETVQQSGQFQGNAGDSLLDRIFQQNTSSPNFMTFFLTREESSTDTSTASSGIFTIGDLLEGNDDILNMPKLEVLNSSNSLGQHWTVQLDGVLGNNGSMVTLAPSVVPGTPSGKAVAIFDSGFTLPQVPQEITNAFYANIPSAQLMNVSGVGPIWTMPCNQPVQGAFIFAGQTYPVHPLDLNADPNFFGQGLLPSGTCFGFFQPIQGDATEAIGGDADMILGMAFLRNVYTLMNFGDFVDASADATMQPFVQLLSITNQTAALAEFKAVRASNGADRSGNGRLGVVFGIAVAILAVMGSV